MSIRKQHLLPFAVFALLIVASCFFEQTDARRHRSRKHCPKDVHIEIYHPKGVLVWYPYRAGLEMFGIEIYINQGRAGSSSEEDTPMTCNICLNTTEVAYGKFILRIDDAIIRHRDHVSYNAILKKTSGEVYIARSNEFYVSDSRILIADLPGTTSKSGTVDTTVTKASPANRPSAAQTALQEEITLLEDILAELNQQCNAGQNQTKQLVLNTETSTRLDAKELYQFVERELTTKLPTIDWSRTLVDAYYATNGIAFEVPTIVDKLKILKLAKKLPEHTIEDWDTLSSEDASNDIDTWLVV